jgi:hypothetical protein
MTAILLIACTALAVTIHRVIVRPLLVIFDIV